MVVCKPFTMGYFVPSSPTSGDIHIYDADASSLSNHRNNADTADLRRQAWAIISNTMAQTGYWKSVRLMGQFLVS